MYITYPHYYDKLDVKLIEHLLDFHAIVLVINKG